MYPVHRRSLAYIVQLSFRLRNSNSRMASTIHPSIRPDSSSIAKVWSVKSSMRCKNQSKLPWRRGSVTSSMPLEPICNGAFFSFTFGVHWFFLFRKPCRSNLGPSRNSSWMAKTEDPWKGAQTAITWLRWRFSETWAPIAFLAAWSADGPVPSKIRAPTKPSLGKDASFGWFVTAYVRWLECPYKCESSRKF